MKYEDVLWDEYNLVRDRQARFSARFEALASRMGEKQFHEMLCQMSDSEREELRERLSAE